MKLIDKRVLITRSRAQSEEFGTALIAQGALPIFFPVIEIIPPADFFDLDHALQDLDQYDWLMLTSVHAVDAFFQRLVTLDIKNIPSHMRVAVVGAKTAQALSTHGITADHVPNEYVSEGMLSGLNENISGKRFLLPQSNLSKHVLADEIRSAGGIADEVVAYQNVIGQPDVAGLQSLRCGVDVVTFTSPSTVRNFMRLVRENGLDPLNLPGKPFFACIGPVTKKTAEEANLGDLIVAEEYTTEGIIRVLSDLAEPVKSDLKV
jgi:uroporphyrinogen-III synthase